MRHGSSYLFHFKIVSKQLKQVRYTPRENPSVNNICDMIKGNELDVPNIDFDLQAERGDKFLCFALF